MKLLFDENLSAVLSRQLADIFAGSAHLGDVGLNGADDRDIWVYAGANEFVIVTKDDDFKELSILQGIPPKLVMIRLGNCATDEVEGLLRRTREELEDFAGDPVASVMEIP